MEKWYDIYILRSFIVISQHRTCIEHSLFHSPGPRIISAPLPFRCTTRHPALSYLTLVRMAPPTRPSSIDNFFVQHQGTILASAFATQVLHYQYIRRTQPIIDSGLASAIRTTNFPRSLRAGLGWGVVFIGLLTQITLAKRTVREFSDPISAMQRERRQWTQSPKDNL